MRIAMRKIIAFVLTICMMTGIMSVTENRQVQAATLRLSQKSATLIAGDTLRLYVTGSKAKVTWSTSDKKVATVSTKGIVSAKKDGNVKITAAVGKKKLSCSIVVLDNMGEALTRAADNIARHIEAQSLKPETMKITTFEYGDYPDDLRATHDNTAKWRIIATVERKDGKQFYVHYKVQEDGIVLYGLRMSDYVDTSSSDKTSKIYSEEEIQKFTNMIQLFYKHPYDSNMGSIKVSEEELTLMMGKMHKLELMNTDSKVTWKSSSSSIVRVAADGKIKALKEGNAVITASVGGKSYKSKVHVLPKLTEDELIVLSDLTGHKKCAYYPESVQLHTLELGDFEQSEKDEWAANSEENVRYTVKATYSMKDGKGNNITHILAGGKTGKKWVTELVIMSGGSTNSFNGRVTETYSNQKIQKLQEIIDSDVMLYYDTKSLYGRY